MAILTISREFGSGAKGVGEAVAAALGYDYVDRRRVLKEMEKEDPVFEAQTKRFEERDPGVWGRYDWSFRGFTALYQSVVLDHAKEDRVVISATGAPYLLRGIPHVLRVFVKAPMESRITRVRGDDIVNRETAKWIIERADEEMGRAIYTLYGRRWDDPSEYDMVFDAPQRTPGQMVDEIKTALAAREERNTEKARSVLSLRALAAKMKAMIAIDPQCDVTTLEVEPKEEGLPEYGLVIKGIVREEADIKEIESFAHRLAGDVPLEIRLIYKWYSRIGPWQFK